MKEGPDGQWNDNNESEGDLIEFYAIGSDGEYQYTSWKSMEVFRP